MNRRGFLLGLVAAPAAVVTAAGAVLNPMGIRMSLDKADPGYRAYAIANGDRRKIDIFFNGVLQKYVTTADERLGMIVRIVQTPDGNFAHGKEELFSETVYGDVRIVIS